jgi:tetratricopeptide (TPR) repeat protein
MSSRLLCLFVLLLCSPLAYNQRRPGSGTGGAGNTGGGQPNFSTIPQPSRGAQLQIRVTWGNSRSVDGEILHVQLLSSGNTPAMDTFANHEGTASFMGIAPGNYRVKIDGPNINETYSDAFEIGGMEQFHLESVSVKPKETVDNKNLGATPMISASELNVPPKAKKEMEKGMQEFSKGDLKQSEEHLRKSVAIYPKYARGWNNLGVILMREGDKPGAIEAWQKSIAADSKFPSGYLNMARLEMKDKKMPEAADYIAKAVACDPNNPDALALRASEELFIGEYDKALADARRVHEIPHAQLADVHLIAAEALLHMDKNAEALKEYEIYLKENPDSPNAASVRTAMAQIQAKMARLGTN